MNIQTRMQRLTWLYNRLSCMSVAEVSYRFMQALLVRLMKWNVLRMTIPHSLRIDSSMTGVLPVPKDIAANAYVEEAEAILRGEVILFYKRRFSVGCIPEWNRDPLTGIVGPDCFSLGIPITRRELVGDIKHVWELNRHLHLVRLAQAYSLTGEQRYLDGLAARLNSWIAQCPPLRGPNWTSSLEAGIRLINWSLIWQLVGGRDSVLFQDPEGERLRQQWVESVYAHCWFIRKHFSRHSSANNHLIGELAGLYMAARTWPCWDEADNWARQAKLELEREIQLQHSADGVNREQAFSYQVFSAEFLVMAGMHGARSGDHFSEQYWMSLHSALHFLHAVRDVGGNVPMVGDADDGMALRLEPGEASDRAGMILDLGMSLFDRSHHARRDSTKWLAPETVRNAIPDRKIDDGLWDFSDGGYLLFGSGFGGSDEIKGMVDCGRLGYLGIAAHGHADALSITLSIRGEECLVDPGTFSYWNDIKWRDYFRGTSAHNTVRIDGVDQSVSGGRFMWTRKANTKIENKPQAPGDFDFAGSHDGYARLQDPVTHRRRIRYIDADKTLQVWDEVSGRTAHAIEQFWHFAPHLDVRIVEDNMAQITGKAFSLRLEISGPGVELDIVRGSEDPPSGWYSDSYECKEPTSVLRVHAVSNAIAIGARFTLIDAQSSTDQSRSTRRESSAAVVGIEGGA